MSDLKLIAKKEEVEKEISLLEKQKAKHGEIWSTEEAYLVVLQDWLAMHAEIERLNELRRWKSCVSELPKDSGYYLTREAVNAEEYRHDENYYDADDRYWKLPCYEWLEIPE